MITTIADALTERGYETLTDVQIAVSDPELKDADLLVSAQTGSGKTVGFGLAIAPTLLGEDGMFGPAAAPLALVVAPTRELAMQVKRELGWLYAKAGVRMASCVGGMDARDERRTLERGAHIVVGTPGRLRDHITRGALSLEDVRVVVLDEADEMLDLGFREDLEFMLAEAPETRRTLLFSATVPPMIVKMAQEFQRDAIRISTVAKGDQHADITYQAVTVAHTEVENAIINLLRYHDAQNTIVFANTRAGVSRLMARFSNRGFRVVSLSGELSQTERTHALQAMRDGRANVCVATDVAARGIDLPNLELVIHADLPSGSEPLLHRSGRTGRAGRKGTSVLIVTPKTVKKAERLLKWAKIKADWVAPPSAEQILQKDQERLLSDPLWMEEVTPQQSEFAETLLAMHTPAEVAAAFLRLYQSRQSAPEDLSAPEEKPARKSHDDFGPSTWFSMSIGRQQQAEPRWLLPMLLRNAGLEKNAIGAIRVQQQETYVEVNDSSVPALMDFLGNGGELEKGIRLTKLDSKPDLSAQAPANSAPARPAPRPRAEKAAGATPTKKVWSEQPAAPEQDREDTREDRKPREFREPREVDARKPRWKADKDGTKKPFRKKDEDRPDRDSVKPRFKSKDKPDDKPEGRSFDRPKGKGYGKPFAKGDGKPSGKPGNKPFGKPGGKPTGKPGGKPGGKPFGKPGGKPKTDGPSKPGHRGKRPLGGSDVPRRQK